VRSYVGDKPMYNLTIQDTHTYYVVAGTTPVLVHNVCDGDGWGSNTRLAQKFEKHGEKLGYETEWEYENGSIDLTCVCDGRRSGVLSKTDSVSGKTYFYDPHSGEFAIVLRGNGILDYYHLDGGIGSFNGMPGMMNP